MQKKISQPASSLWQKTSSMVQESCMPVSFSTDLIKKKQKQKQLPFTSNLRIAGIGYSGRNL